MEFTYRGLTINTDDGPYDLQTIEGLYGAEVRTDGDLDQPRGDGALPGQHYLGPKHINFEVRCFGHHDEVIPPLLAAFQPARRVESPLTWSEPSGERLVYARVVASPVTLQSESWNATDVRIGLKASDPRIYGTRHVVRVEPFAVVEGGLDYPVVNYPKDFKPDVTTTAVASNVGDSDAHPTVRIHGPVSGTTTSWRLRNTTNGSELQVDTALGPGQLLTVRQREWVVADPSALIVELDGASRYGGWVSRPEVLWLEPGDNVLRLEVLGGDVPTAVEVIYRDTWAGTRRNPTALVSLPGDVEASGSEPEPVDYYGGSY